MGFNFADAKKQVRRTVNTTFGVVAFYMDDSLNAPIETRARWHNQINSVAAMYGDDERQGYARLEERIERIALIPEIWINGGNTGQPFNLKRNGQFTFPDYEGMTFYLGEHDPIDGPLEQVWQVTRTPS